VRGAQCALDGGCGIQVGHTWVGRYMAGVPETAHLSRYTRVSYFVNYTIFTIGYGDLVPQVRCACGPCVCGLAAACLCGCAGARRRGCVYVCRALGVHGARTPMRPRW
jgi:hypothetical protein